MALSSKGTCSQTRAQRGQTSRRARHLTIKPERQIHVRAFKSRRLKEREMPPTVRLFGTDNEEIHTLDAWFEHAPPENGLAQWKDGYSAKEQAKAWLRPGQPSIPTELWSATADLAGGSDQIYGRPEHQTRLDRFSRARQHDLFGCV